MQLKSQIKLWQTVRRVLALACLVLLTLTALGIVRVGWLGRAQVVPALLAGSVGLLVAVGLVTLLTGRTYCAVLCPLGVAQDVVRRLTGRRDQHYRRPWVGYALRTAVLAVAIYGFARGLYMLTLLTDPFSHFTRAVLQLGRPLWLWVKGALASADVASPLWFEGEVVMEHHTLALTLALVVVLVLTLTAWLWGRAFCHLFCPVGYVMGWLSHVAPWGVHVDVSRCTHCGACERACRSSCLRSADGHLDRGRCVVCLECAARCPQGAITVGWRWPWRRRPSAVAADAVPPAVAAPAPPAEALSRRRFLASVGAVVAAPAVVRAQQVAEGYDKASRRLVDAGEGYVTYQYDPNETRRIPSVMPGGEVVTRRTYAIMPPSTVMRPRFLSHCIACGLCIAHCPQHILRPATGEYGPQGRMKPTVDFALGWCRPECNRCAEVCPTDAIRLLPTAEKGRDRLGWATFNSQTCVTVTDGVTCDACQRHCPHQAIELVQHGDHRIPKVSTRRCTGCGACEYYCPARPKAIRVEGLKG